MICSLTCNLFHDNTYFHILRHVSCIPVLLRDGICVLFNVAIKHSFVLFFGSEILVCLFAWLRFHARDGHVRPTYVVLKTIFLFLLDLGDPLTYPALPLKLTVFLTHFSRRTSYLAITFILKKVIFYSALHYITNSESSCQCLIIS